MHRIIRIAIALIAGLVACLLLVVLIGIRPNNIVDLVSQLMLTLRRDYRSAEICAIVLVIILPTVITGLVTYVILARMAGPSTCAGGETYCRRCASVLRDLAEPQCPHCGERI
jgi:hypothetical protein